MLVPLMDENEQPFDVDEVARLMREASEKARGYSDFWQWRSDKVVTETQVTRTLLEFIEASEGESIHSVKASEQDPPDCIAELADGRKIGIEVTELVDEPTAARHAARRGAERRGEQPHPSKAAEPGEVAVWTVARLSEALVKVVAKKDVSALGGPYYRYLVAIHTDEMTITPSLLSEALAGLLIETQHIDRVYVLFSYDPAAKLEFPNGYPVIPLPLLRAGHGEPQR